MQKANPSPREKKKSATPSFLKALFFFSTLAGLALLVFLIVDLFAKGSAYLTWDLLANLPSRFAEHAGLRAAIYGTLWIISLTAAISLPMGIFAAIYLAEYAPRSRLAWLIDLTVANLAGVPSILYGLIGLGFFAELLLLRRSVLAGSLTLSLMILPIIIMTTKEALMAVPTGHRMGAYALGATQGQVIRRIVLPQALPGMLTGSILSISRAIGETAPLLVISALVYITYTPANVFDRFTVIPLQIFAWMSFPQEPFRELAAAASLVLLGLILAINAAAISLRSKYQVRVKE